MEGMTNLQISGSMFRMLAGMDSGNEGLNGIASSINSLQILHAPRELAESKGLNFYAEILPYLPLEAYNEVLRVNNPEQRFSSWQTKMKV
jgi:hypothetical protein